MGVNVEIPRFNKLTPAEDERLSILAEECAEVIQIIMKIKRHGYESYSPDDPNRITNRVLLMEELSDTRQATSMLIKAGDFDHEQYKAMVDQKLTTPKRYTHHQ